jgi:hypothetical protein
MKRIQGYIPSQVAQRVSGQAEFREHNQLRTLPLGFLDCLEMVVEVAGNVPDFGIGLCKGYFEFHARGFIYANLKTMPGSGSSQQKARPGH